jgi:hypothetical protein
MSIILSSQHDINGNLKYKHELTKVADNLYRAASSYYSVNQVPYLDRLFSHVDEQGLYVYTSKTHIDRTGNTVYEAPVNPDVPPIVFCSLTVDKWMFGIEVLETPALYEMYTRRNNRREHNDLPVIV